MKKLLMTFGVACLVIATMGQSIKGPNSISYFQAPSKGIEFLKANVFMSYDQKLATAKKETKQAKNSALGAKFGSFGSAIAKGVNKGMDAMEDFNKMLDAYKDEKGRFSQWDFVPAYIMTEANTKKSVNVEIFVLNEPNPSPSASMPSKPDSEGYYDIPYYVNCRYKVMDHTGKLLLEENLGVLQGSQKTKDYTPVQAPTLGGIGKSLTKQAEETAKDLDEGNVEDEVPIQDRIGTNVAFNAVRTSVFARYGFGQFNAPIKLGVVKESKVSKKMIKPTLAVFTGKKGLLLNKKEKEKVQAFANEMEKVLPSTSAKTKWVALHNLSVCYAWLEDAEKASNYYKQYGEEIKSTLEKMDCWNAILAGTMTSKEMKSKVGSTFIGTKEIKQYEQYFNVNNFVNYYPAGAKRYEALMLTINRDLKRFVDFYAVNDLLCQLFEIDFPFQFFPLQDCNGAPKDMRATIQKEGMQPIEYRVKYDSKRRIKELQADQVSVLSDGNKEKLVTRDIMPKYSGNEKYSHLETDAGIWAQAAANSNSYYSSLNYVHDPILANTYGKAENITKKVGFFGDKESEETVRLKVDLEGNIYFTGNSKYFKANAFFKEMLDASGIVPKRVHTTTTFTTKANINEEGAMTSWRWEGDVKTDMDNIMKTRERWLAAKPMVRGIQYKGQDDKGNPTEVDFEFSLNGSMAIEEKAKGMAFVNKYLVDLGGPKPTVSKDNFSFDANTNWNCSFEYDANGNWTKMKVGPYTAERSFKY
ncbi:MAG: hypothetical protein N4A74_05745 [Carboxylicivirga sp.]|jgi:hypothetical protein|nr:hypothetical protein [Carboxylicivirga sp.]